MSLRDLFTFRFKPNADLVAVMLSWVLVTGSLATATFVVGAERGGYYFLVYGVLTALVCGVALPTWWMVWHRKRSVADLGVTTKLLGVSLGLQLVLSVVQYFLTLARVEIPPLAEFAPLMALAVCVGFFEALFWRGWVLLRLEEQFGFIPAWILGSALYAVYHVGYGMPWSEMGLLFVVGLVYALIFRFTRNVFILWPLLQPMGQLTTLLRDGLSLPGIAVVGFLEVLAVMFVVLFLAKRHEKKRARSAGVPATAEGAG